MGFAAFPLIVGIGIDNGIHLVRRHLEMPGRDVRQLLGVSGAALIQTNLTTIVGFGALLSATIPPLAELGLITAVGIGFTLLASIFLVPAILVLARRIPASAPAAGSGGDALGGRTTPPRRVTDPGRASQARWPPDSSRAGSAPMVFEGPR